MCVCVCVCIRYIFFLHLSAVRPLGCFHVLAIVNSASMNIVVHASFQINSFHLFQVYIQEWDCWIIRQLYF